MCRVFSSLGARVPGSRGLRLEIVSTARFRYMLSQDLLFHFPLAAASVDEINVQLPYHARAHVFWPCAHIPSGQRSPGCELLGAC